MFAYVESEAEWAGGRREAAGGGRQAASIGSTQLERRKLQSSGHVRSSAHPTHPSARRSAVSILARPSASMAKAFVLLLASPKISPESSN